MCALKVLPMCAHAALPSPLPEGEGEARDLKRQAARQCRALEMLLPLPKGEAGVKGTKRGY